MVTKMGSICRLCLHKNESDAMKNIFEFSPKYFELNLTEILYWIFDVEIVVEDTYSKLICYKCLNVIESIGRYRQFFQVNQTFLHERRCPVDYEVKSGWYNTRDIGINTEPQNSDYVKISLKDLNALNTPQVKLVRLEKSKPLDENKNVGKLLPKQIEVIQQNVEKVKHEATEEHINVPLNIFKEFRISSPINLRNTINASHDRIDVPLSAFDCVLPQVTVPNIEDECLNQGYIKVGENYYKPNKDIPFVQLQKIECDNLFLKNYKKIGKYTFKKILYFNTEHFRLQKNKLIRDYYYRMPTSALRELITETNPPKNKKDVSINSLVTTNEIHVHVCEYCSKVFKHRHNLSDHCIKVHQKLLKRKHRRYCKYLLPAKKSDKNKDSHTIISSQHNGNCINTQDSLEVSTYVNNIHKFKTDNGNKNIVNNKEGKEQETSLIIVDAQLGQNTTAIKESSEEQNISDLRLSFNELNIDLSSSVHSNDLSENEIERDPLDISSENPEMQNGSDSESSSSTWLRVKDLKQLQNAETQDNIEQPERIKATNNDFHMDYLKTVIFGEHSEINPKITYHSDNSCNLQDHNYVTNFEKTTSTKNLKTPTKKPVGRPSRKKMTTDVVNMIKKRFADIKKTRAKLEKVQKIQFALYNEIENCNIHSSLKALQEKLQMSEMT